MANADDKSTILIVDDTPANIDVLKSVLAEDYKIKAAINGPMALKILANQSVDLILLDIMMPDMDGYEVCGKIKSTPSLANIPVIFVTALNEIKDETKGLEVGAVDYLVKPVIPAIVRARVRNHLDLADQQKAIERIVKLRTKELEESQKAAISMLGEAGHYNDTDTGVHIWRMADYAAALAMAAGWKVEEAELLRLAAPMHDMGKVGIPDAILKAERRLTPEEMEIMKEHSKIGHKILSKSSTRLFKIAADVAMYHHEKWNGEGYPDGLKEDQIPQSARIVAIADVFDALTMKRPYKEAWSVEDAFALIKKDAGSHFDPHLAELFQGMEEELLKIKQRWDEQE